MGFLSHSRIERSTGAPSPGKQCSRLAGEQAALLQTRGWGWAHQNRTTLEKDFSNDEGWFPDNKESFPLEMSQSVATWRQHGALVRWKSPLCSPAATPWKHKAQEPAPGLPLGRLGLFPTSLLPTKALGLAIELFCLPPYLSAEMLPPRKWVTPYRGAEKPSGGACLCVDSEGRRLHVSANTKCLNQELCRGSGLTLCRPQVSIGCPAHPAHSVTAFSPSSSFFTPPHLPAPQHVLAHKQCGWRAGPPITNRARLAVWAHHRWPPCSLNNKESTWAAATM